MNQDMVMMDKPSPSQVGREFVRQYYTLLNKAPSLLHRFYSVNSSYVHGGKYSNGEPEKPVIGQNDIHLKIESLNFCDCHTKIRQVDAHSTIGSGVVVQVTGELSNAGRPLRRFMQTFVLAPQGDNPFKFYVHNDIFRYQDDVFSDDNQGEHSEEEDQDVEEEEEEIHHDPPLDAAHYQPPVLNHDSTRPSQPDDLLTNGMQQQMESIAIDQVEPPKSLLSDQRLASDPPQRTPSPDPMPETNEPSSSESKAYVEDQLEEPEPAFTELDLEESKAPSKPFSWADMISKNTSGTRSSVPPPQAPARVTRPAPPEHSTEQPDNADQSSRQSQRGARGNQRSYPRDDERSGGFGDRMDRRSGPGREQTGGTRYPDNQQIFVGNLPYDITEDELQDHFADFGQVLEVKINHSMTNNPSFGFVIFRDSKAVENVLRVMPTQYKNSHRINIEEKKQRNNRDGNRRVGEPRRGGGGMGDIRSGRRGQPLTRRDRQGSREGPRPNYNSAPRR